jgi:tRNA pseudouridine(55) synthase
MIEFYKQRGETPLQALDRLRIDQPELTEEILSYAGRLDPMAEGILPILVGREENVLRQEFLHKDKEYRAQFMLGISTDTGDVLGVIQKTNFKHIDTECIKKACEDLIQITKQTYPWYSSKPVNGISLFEHARNGNLHIERPTKEMKIYSVDTIECKKINSKELIEEIILDIKKVKGDFRQEEIVKGWNKVCHPELVSGSRNSLRKIPKQVRDDTSVQLISCTLKVSSGTYIRGLCEVLEEKLGVPALLYKLIRTKIGI